LSALIRRIQEQHHCLYGIPRARGLFSRHTDIVLLSKKYKKFGANRMSANTDFGVFSQDIRH
jgi:hypothetical protein